MEDAALPSYIRYALPVFERILTVGVNKKRNALLEEALRNKQCTKAVIEFAYNVLYNDAVHFSAATKKRLRVHKRHYERLSGATDNLSAKRRLIEKRGHEFVPDLLKTIVPILRNHDGSGYETHRCSFVRAANATAPGGRGR